MLFTAQILVKPLVEIKIFKLLKRIDLIEKKKKNSNQITLMQVHSENGNVMIKKKYDSQVNRLPHMSKLRFFSLKFKRIINKQNTCSNVQMSTANLTHSRCSAEHWRCSTVSPARMVWAARSVLWATAPAAAVAAARYHSDCSSVST